MPIKVENYAVVSSALILAASTVVDMSTYNLDGVASFTYKTPFADLHSLDVFPPTVALLDTNNSDIVIFNSTSPPSGRLSNTELGRRLIEIRNKAISRGLKLKNLDEINAEVAKLRGDRSTGDA